MILPGALDAQCRLRFVAFRQRPQLAYAAQATVGKEPVQHAAEIVRQLDVVANEVVGYAAAESAAAAGRIEAQQMIAIEVAVAAPQFADHPAGEREIGHQKPPLGYCV